MIKYIQWPDGEVETLRSAKPPCAGPIPALASMIKIKAKKTNLIESLVGLIGEKKPYPLLLNTNFGIHTFFMKYPIDIVVLDKNNTVVKIKRNLAPWKLFFYSPIYSKILELPYGFIDHLKIKVSSKLDIYH